MKSIAVMTIVGVAGLLFGAGSFWLVLWMFPMESSNSRDAEVTDAEWLGGLSRANGVRRRYNPYDDEELKSAWDRGWDDQP